MEHGNTPRVRPKARRFFPIEVTQIVTVFPGALMSLGPKFRSLPCLQRASGWSAACKERRTNIQPTNHYQGEYHHHETRSIYLSIVPHSGGGVSTFAVVWPRD